MALATTIVTPSRASFTPTEFGVDMQEIGLAVCTVAPSYAVPTDPWRQLFLDSPSAIRTAVSDAESIVVGPDRPEDFLVSEIIEFRKLDAGWDGETAERPPSTALRDAIQFARAARSLAGRFDASLHVDGSVVFGIEDGAEGSLRFKGDGQVIYSFRDAQGVEPVSRFEIPSKILAALSN